LTKWKLPKVKRSNINLNDIYPNFPIHHYSTSSFIKFSENPFMFKVNYINGDYLDTATSVSSVLGRIVHKALQAYLGGEEDVPTPADEGEAIKHGYDRGMWHLKQFPEGLIEYSKTIPNMQSLIERFSFTYFGYVKSFNLKAKAKEVLFCEKKLEYQVSIEDRVMPIPLKGIPDLVYEDKKGRIVIHDHKTCYSHSKVDEIDGAKLIQLAILYFLVYAETGKKPHRFVFGEFKYSENKDKTIPQYEEYTLVFEDTPLAFDLFYRLYEDITKALLGEMVFVPNLSAMWDKEVSILAYIERLDEDNVRAEKLKQEKVNNITDFLRRKIEKDGNYKKYLETVKDKFISATTLNYKDMKTEDKIKYKLAEHGIAVDFDSKVDGYSVDLYRYEPSIGVKMSRIEGFSKDIEQVVGVSGIRILAPIPNSTLIGFEIPKKERVFLNTKPTPNGFNLTLGVDMLGEEAKIDIRETPHLLVAGTTGSGKSVFLSSIIAQLCEINNASLILLDPKKVELESLKENKAVKEYADDPEMINIILTELVVEMNDRYSTLKKLGKKNIQNTDLNYIFCVIDEFGDLISGNSGFEDDIRRNILILSQKARASGIHLIIATQRPSVKIITGDIKTNFPTRVAFRVPSATDSKVILDEAGAEKLLGKGDMLVQINGSLTRLQGYNI